jgi:hypothetical protein
MRYLTDSGALRPWVSVLVAIVGMGVALGLGIGWVSKVDRDAERRNIERSRDLCRILILLDDRQQQRTPTNQDDADFIAAVHDLRISKGC